jgi:Tfp pilus assembly protein PilN
MHKQRLDFAHPQPVVKLNGMLAGAAVLAAGLALALALSAYYHRVSSETQATEFDLARLARQSGNPAPAAPKANDALRAEVKRVNQAAAQLTIPWEDLFRAVEAATGKKIALLALQPNFQRHELKLSGEADDFASIRRYMDQLDGSKILFDVRLQSHEVISRPNASAIRFELTATWKADA